ncbi:MAG: MarR family transcriptional regulator [Desulfuromonas sp.]|nr:MAG: MarR family transcriptional regulator [Desulfuromonas sp.]
MEKSTDKFASDQEPHIPQASYDLRILQALRRIIRAVDIHSHKLSSLHNITGPQLACLMAIKEEAPISSSHLAKKVYLSPSTVVGIVDRLEEKNLVKRNRDSKDRRLVHLLMTPLGEKLVDEAPSLLQETLANSLVELPEIEQVSITLALEKLVDLMEARHIGAAPLLETGSLSKGK